MVFAMWQSPSFDLLFGMARQRFVAVINVGEGISNLILSLILVKHFGLVGVALGTFIPMAVVKLVVQPIYVAKLLSMSYTKYILSVAKPALAACGALALPALVSMKYAAPSYFVLFVVAIVSLFFYSIFVWIFQFTSSETRMIRQVIFSR
jgi:O-antigen/teichoic acid export membrane protein